MTDSTRIVLAARPTGEPTPNDFRTETVTLREPADGEVVLQTLSIEMPAFRIAGGALLFWIAFEMLFAKRSERKERGT